jgi:NRPS condensation-like uncharacterized protein
VQTRLEDADDREVAAADAADLPSLRDPAALLAHLDASGRFHRDGPAGRIYHRGQVSLRENVPTDSLHVVVDGNFVGAHVDAVSPLRPPERGTAGYSVVRAGAHNLAGMAEDAIALVRGRKGDHESRLECEWAPGEPEQTPERLGLLDPRESAWSVQLEARFGVSLDEDRMRAALGAALGSTTGERDPLELAACDDDEALDAVRSRLHTMAIEAGAGPPLHACLARHPAGDVLMLTLNHAACDGFGALRVLRAIGAAYAGDGDREALEFLAGEELPVRPAAVYVPPLPERARKRAVERARDALTRPAELAADEPQEHSGVGFELICLTADETRRLRSADPAAGATNALVAALHLAIGAWNAEHDEPCHQIGVLVAVSLRPQDFDEDTIGNFSVNARFATARRNRSGAAAALWAIAAQMQRSERERTGTALIAGLRRNGLLGLWAKQSTVVLRPLTTNHTVDAALLCDLGAVDGEPWFGDDAGEIAELWFSVPSRSPLSVSIGAVTVGGRLNVTLRYPRCLFSAAAARRFAQRYAESLRALGEPHRTGSSR